MACVEEVVETARWEACKGCQGSHLYKCIRGGGFVKYIRTAISGERLLVSKTQLT